MLREPSASTLAEPALRPCRYAAALVLTAAAGILGAGLWNIEALQSANDRSRWCTIWSLVERGSYRIDEIDAYSDWSTIDKVRHEGHFYSSKPPLLATMYAGVYWVVRSVTGWDLLSRTNDVARIILLITQVIPWLLALAVWGRVTERLTSSDTARVLMLVTVAFGTLLTPFVLTVNNHLPGAISAMFALYSTIRLMMPNVPPPSTSENGAAAARADWFHSASAGFFTAFTVTCELPAALFAVVIFGLLLRRNWKQTLFAFVPAALVPLAAYFVTNAIATGGWKPFYSFYGTEKYEYVHNGIPSYWKNPKGLDRAVDSPLVYLMHCTIGHHGLLSLTPIWLLSLFGWGMTFRRETTPLLRTLLIMGAVLNVVVLGFYLTRTANYNYGGNTAALRWMLWLTPFWLIGLIPPAERWGNCRWFRMGSAALLAVSVFSAHASLNNPWRSPWLFSVMQRFGWLTQYTYETAKPFSHPLTTWFPSLPNADAGEAWVEFESAGLQGGTDRLRLSLLPEESSSQTAMIRLEQYVGEGRIDERFRIHRARFESGADPEQFVEWPDGMDQERKNEQLTLLRGLPAPRAYREGVERYLRTRLRTDAFRCQRAASRVAVTLPGTSRTVWHRTDLWLCPEIPFGVAQLEVTITDADSAEVIGTRRWLLRDYAPREARADADADTPLSP